MKEEIKRILDEAEKMGWINVNPHMNKEALCSMLCSSLFKGMTVEGWIEGFDELVGHFKRVSEIGNVNTAFNKFRTSTNSQFEKEIKSFISNLVAQTRKEERRRACKIVANRYGNGVLTISDILESNNN